MPFAVQKGGNRQSREYTQFFLKLFLLCPYPVRCPGMTPNVPVYETEKLTTNTIQLQNAANGLYFVVVFLKDGTMLTQKMMVGRP